MTNNQSPVNETQQRAPYETPVVIELNVGGGTDGKTTYVATELDLHFGPS